MVAVRRLFIFESYQLYLRKRFYLLAPRRWPSFGQNVDER